MTITGVRQTNYSTGQVQGMLPSLYETHHLLLLGLLSISGINILAGLVVKINTPQKVMDLWPLLITLTVTKSKATSQRRNTVVTSLAPYTMYQTNLLKAN